MSRPASAPMNRSAPTILLVVMVLVTASPAGGQVEWERWVLVPDLRIGAFDGSNQALSQVGGLAVAGDGTMYVTQPAERLVRVYDPSGRFLRTIGREGSGPGEFRSIGSIGIRSDTLWISDTVQYRLTLFSRAGEPLDVLAINGVMIPGVSTRPTPPSVLAHDGTLLARPLTSGRDDLSAVPIVRMDRNGGMIEMFGTLRHEPPIVLEMGSGRRRIVELRVPPVPQGGLWSMSPVDGSIIVVDRPAADAAARGRFRVERLRSAADTVFSREYLYTPRRIPASFADSLVQSGEPPEVSPVSRNEYARMLRDALRFPEFEPPISALVAGRDGTIWIRRERLGVAEVVWNVLDEAGEMIAYLRLPVNLRILAAQRDRVWGVETDELDVPYLVRFTVEPGRD